MTAQAGGQDGRGRRRRQHGDKDKGGETQPGGDPGAVRQQPKRAEDQRAPGKSPPRTSTGSASAFRCAL